ncbi:hypothetical protein K503DRAFT_732676 [Rhizopogon vinicolor AM-OR11-026]|uniref:Uncharacterized protein n=1 Tax=Rhizopogon vinicolor AM-OR11-026 TaxID=1314800 RepID=A0A1B7NDF3_9AGAM|nr:hypothetical protein K503DRAFT_732676 [Rhizopogon vinicolor AM-OR11-026]
MPIPKSFRLTYQQRRTFVSTLFGLTFFASVLTVSASNVLPCPVRSDRSRYADTEGKAGGKSPAPVIERRPRRWIQERSSMEDTPT